MSSSPDALSTDSTRLFAIGELVDAVSDFLWDDTASLLAFSLVCKLWASTAATHLFRTIKFDPRKLLLNEDEHALDPVHFWLKAHPRITSHVLTVFLTDKKDMSQLLPHSSLFFLPLALISDIVALFPQLRLLEIWFESCPLTSDLPCEDIRQGIDNHDLGASEAFSRLGVGAPHAPRYIRGLRIEIDDVLFSHVPLASLLELFTDIGTLMLKNLDCIFGQDYQRLGLRAKVKSLSLSSRHGIFAHEVVDSPVFAVVANTLDPSTLRSLWLSHCHPANIGTNVGVLNGLLRDSAANIETFGMHLRSSTVYRTEIDLHYTFNTHELIIEGLCIVLTPCQRLHTVHFAFSLNTEAMSESDAMSPNLAALNIFEWQNTHIWEPLMRILLSACAALACVTLSIYFKRDSELAEPCSACDQPLRALNWAILHDIVGAHPNLCTVVFQFPADALECARRAVEEKSSAAVRRVVRITPTATIDIAG